MAGENRKTVRASGKLGGTFKEVLGHIRREQQSWAFGVRNHAPL